MSQPIRKFFKIPLFASVLLAAWAIFNVVIVLKVGINGEVLGRLVGEVFIPFLLALVITTPFWFIFRRSQRVASIVFSLVVVLFLASKLAQIGALIAANQPVKAAPQSDATTSDLTTNASK